MGSNMIDRDPASGCDLLGWDPTVLPRDPAADQPVGPRLKSQRRWQTLWAEWREDGPSWLLSLILHFVCLILITSAAGPRLPRGTQTTGRIEIHAGFSEQDRAGEGPEVGVELAEAEPDVDAPSDEATPNVQQPDQVAAPQPLTSPLEQPEPVPPQAPARTNNSATAQPSRSHAIPRTEQAAAMQPSPYATLLQRYRPFAESAPRPTQILQPVTEVPPGPPQIDPREQQLDRIVDDFIAYDIGRLRGAAGATARTRFANLGAEAIPALVRGLNKSAGIHASCPVGVIAGKLLTTLQNSSDPSLREYAINHVGAGVSPAAPHYHRLMALRKMWLGAPAIPQKVATVIERLESRQEGEMMELMLALSDAPAETVVAALRSGDDYLAAAATLAIIQAQQPWTADQKDSLRAAVVFFRTTTENAQLRTLADDAEGRLRRAG